MPALSRFAQLATLLLLAQGCGDSVLGGGQGGDGGTSSVGGAGGAGGRGGDGGTSAGGAGGRGGNAGRAGQGGNAGRGGNSAGGGMGGTDCFSSHQISGSDVCPPSSASGNLYSGGPVRVACTPGVMCTFLQGTGSDWCLQPPLFVMLTCCPGGWGFWTQDGCMMDAGAPD